MKLLSDILNQLNRRKVIKDTITLVFVKEEIQEHNLFIMHFQKITENEKNQRYFIHDAARPLISTVK